MIGGNWAINWVFQVDWKDFKCDSWRYYSVYSNMKGNLGTYDIVEVWGSSNPQENSVSVSFISVHFLSLIHKINSDKGTQTNFLGDLNFLIYPLEGILLDSMLLGASFFYLI